MDYSKSYMCTGSCSDDVRPPGVAVFSKAKTRSLLEAELVLRKSASGIMRDLVGIK